MPCAVRRRAAPRHATPRFPPGWPCRPTNRVPAARARAFGVRKQPRAQLRQTQAGGRDAKRRRTAPLQKPLTSSGTRRWTGTPCDPVYATVTVLLHETDRPLAVLPLSGLFGDASSAFVDTETQLNSRGVSRFVNLHVIASPSMKQLVPLLFFNDDFGCLGIEFSTLFAQHTRGTSRCEGATPKTFDWSTL